MKFKFFIPGVLIFGLLLTNSCKKDNKPWPAQSFPLALVSTGAVSKIVESAANCGGTVGSEGTSALTAVGICWDTVPMPTTLKSRVNIGAGTGTYECQMQGLNPGTKYYVRAYATNATGTKYGQEVSFTTLPKWTLFAANLHGNSISAIVSNASNILIGSSSAGVLRSSDNGLTFALANAGLTNSFVTSMLVSGSNIFTGTSNGVFLSTDNGASWSSASNGLNFLAGITSLASNGQKIFAGTSNGGLFASSDNGASWTVLRDTVFSILNVVSVAAKGTNIYVGTGNGVYVSTNNGSNWTSASAGLPVNAYVTQFFLSGSSLFACVSGSGVYKSTDNCKSWNLLNIPALINPNINAVVQTSKYLFMASASSVYISEDGGNTWNEISAGLNNEFITALGQNGNTVFAGTSQGNFFKKDLP